MRFSAAAAAATATMVRAKVIVLLLFAMAIVAATWWCAHRGSPRRDRDAVPFAAAGSPAAERVAVAAPVTPVSHSPGPAPDQATRVDQIRRDYDEMRGKAAADYRAAGAAFPGGLNAFLRQLSLLEQERRKDLLGVLSMEELEEMELRESHAGELIRRLLGDTPATDEQRRAVFRLERDFDDQFALVFDLSPAFLLSRERARQAVQEKVLQVLGAQLAEAWLRDEGNDFGAFVSFSRAHDLGSETPLALWRLKNELILGRLEIAATSGISPEQVAAATKVLTVRVAAKARELLGATSSAPDADQVLSWLPRAATVP